MSLAPGVRIGPYQVVSAIGAGGMGEVFLATELRLRRQVALKLLPAAVTNDRHRVSRFEQEARAASALSHPNVCTILALGETPEGQHYIAMEYVEGATLRRRLADRRLPIGEALGIAIQIASALVSAHANGVVHRDIKPENVIVRSDGLVKVLDFGLAKLTAPPEAAAIEATQTAFHTDEGTPVGTIAYMSPEQTRGRQVDARSDIWSLGVVLYEMLAGRRPFTGASTSDLIAGILEHEPESLTRFAPDVPQELQRVIGKALRKDVERRYQSSKDLLLDLEALRDDLASRSSVTVAPEASAPKARTRGRVLTAVGLLLLAVGGAGALWIQSLDSGRGAGDRDASAPVHRPLTRLTFDPGLQTGATFSPDGRVIAYASDRAGNFDIWIQPVSGGEARQVTRSPSQDTEPSWSPDGKSIAFRSDRDGGGLFVVPEDGGAERQVSAFGRHPEWSTDGTEILFRGGHGSFTTTNLYAVSAHGGEQPREVAKDFLRGFAWQWVAPHPDGRVSVAGTHPERRAGFFTVSHDGKHVIASQIGSDLPLTATDVVRFQWAPAGTVLYVEANVDQLRNIWKVTVDPTTLAWLAAERLTTGTGSDAFATVSRDGTRMAFTAQQESIRLWAFPFDATAGRIEMPGKPVTSEGGRAENFTLSPDGRFIAYVLQRTGSRRPELWWMDLEDGVTEFFGAHAFLGAWAPDSRTLAYAVSRPDSPPPGERALAVREIEGPERIVGPWSSESILLPTGWTPDGRSVLGTHISPLTTGIAKLALRPISPSVTERSDSILIDEPQWHFWQGTFSPNGRWVSFVAYSINDSTGLELAIAPAEGASFNEWVRVAEQQRWPDKPRWAPDGRTLYFISTEGSSFFNLWGVRFDPDAGRPLGDPFRVTAFDSPALMISPSSFSDLGISAHRAVFTMMTVTGNIWMLDRVDN